MGKQKSQASENSAVTDGEVVDAVRVMEGDTKQQLTVAAGVGWAQSVLDEATAKQVKNARRRVL